jgi:hypothetical protein
MILCHSERSEESRIDPNRREQPAGGAWSTLFRHPERRLPESKDLARQRVNFTGGVVN